ncbi:FAD/NAD-binding domain-containing protein [Gautieria morchelliformis]|nr:FAD/NAD-binding domain-containing protein [Gautieria morchelliformis]
MDYDCIVLGTGNAALCAAIAAVEAGCEPSRVLIVDKAPVEWAGGNSYFTAGAFRTVHGGLQDLRSAVRMAEKDESRLNRIDIEPYTKEQFVEDILRLGNRKSDMKLVDALVGDSREVITWLTESVGVRFAFPSHRQAYEVGGRIKFWGGLELAAQAGGKGLVEALMDKATKLGIQFRWETTVVGFVVVHGEHVRGVNVTYNHHPPKQETLTARVVILACGGFEANKDMRVKYLGPGWDHARVRGTPYNQGDGFKLALDLPPGLRPDLVGDWAGCHSTCWDFNSPRLGGSRDLTNAYTKSGYPLGLMVNSEGRRYVDEGADYRNYTYAIYGKATLRQPGGFAFQVWDQKGTGMLRIEEYGDNVTKRIEAPSIEELARLLEKEGLRDSAAFLETLNEYNEAVKAFAAEFPGRQFNPAVKDGLGSQSSAKSLEIPKSNWARTLDEPPFVAVKITCGVTFTFGGLPIDAETAAVIKPGGDETIDGLLCAGEMVGNIFWGNYPGGSGLTSGAVFGRRAGKEAGRLVKESRA